MNYPQAVNSCVGTWLGLAAAVGALSLSACQSSRQKAPAPGLVAPQTPAPATAPKPEKPKPKPLFKDAELLKQLTPANSRIEISLGERRAYVFMGDQLVIDTPVSPGKKSHPTPTGSFTIIEKEKNHRSNLYGKILNAGGGVVRGNADSTKHKPPAGGKFLGASMPYFMRLTNDGVGLHQGHVPDYAASHGCVRLPGAIAATIYAKTKVGTPVVIRE